MGMDTVCRPCNGVKQPFRLQARWLKSWTVVHTTVILGI